VSVLLGEKPEELWLDGDGKGFLDEALLLLLKLKAGGKKSKVFFYR